MVWERYWIDFSWWSYLEVYFQWEIKIVRSKIYYVLTWSLVKVQKVNGNGTVTNSRESDQIKLWNNQNTYMYINIVSWPHWTLSINCIRYLGFFFLPIFWMFLFVWITLADLYLLTNQLIVYKFACMLGTYIVPTNLIPENYLVTCTLFKFIYIFVQITSIEQWTLQHYQDFLSLMMEILLIKVTIITKLLIFHRSWAAFNVSCNIIYPFITYPSIFLSWYS